MSFFISSESRGHAKFIEGSIQRFNETLSEGDIPSRLGSYASKLATRGEGIYIPNVRHGVVTIPKEYMQTDALPALALQQWDTIRLSEDFAVITPGRAKRTLEVIENAKPTRRTPEEAFDIYQDSTTQQPQALSRRNKKAGCEPI